MRKHPHGRGEEIRCYISSYLDRETPPRAWGRGGNRTASSLQSGNTPTGVGKSRRDGVDSGNLEKHPHGRGEEQNSPKH